MAEKTLVMKLLIDTQTNRVLYAEAGKEVVDFLFGLLALPLGSILKLLRNDQMVGSIGSIYSSLESLDVTYLQPNQHKDNLLNPKGQSQDNLLLPAPSPAEHSRYFRCNPSGANHSNTYYGDYSKSCGVYFTEACGGRCPCCNREMKTEMKRVNSGQVASNQVVGEQKGYVKGVVTYTIMDDLSVMPMSSISSITMLNKFGVKNVNFLKEENVRLGLDKALKLLKASFESKTVLTDVDAP
ncbi:hypothetical protein J5N97_011076 [Dioscorea zingiberensis]|uniref:DUF674 domain-containing protein n=1 Tax=Dioscorea zingiberensis TaxID=325984 RepID=A0A9D5CZX9_9LILI|nr:hypothetical protein J5N97_011076 [Dioscorea zingiberensis]